MRIGSLCPFNDPQRAAQLVELGFEFLELLAPDRLPTQIPEFELPDVPIVWQCPITIPSEHPDPIIAKAVLLSWLAHLDMAKAHHAVLMVIQFRRPEDVPDKPALYALVEHYAGLLRPLTEHARAANVQIVLRNSHDNRDQLNILREIVRAVPGLGIGLDIAYAHHQVVKNLTNEYLWDSDLGGRIAHVYASDTTRDHAALRLPLGSVGHGGPEWAKLVSLLRERYNASVSLDIGTFDEDYLALSRSKWLAWWNGNAAT